MVDATNKRVMRGTPRMNSINETEITRTDKRLDCRPRANKMPKGNDAVMPVMPTIMVNMKPPNVEVSTTGRPKIPPTMRKNATTG